MQTLDYVFVMLLEMLDNFKQWVRRAYSQHMNTLKWKLHWTEHAFIGLHAYIPVQHTTCTIHEIP